MSLSDPNEIAEAKEKVTRLDERLARATARRHGEAVADGDQSPAQVIPFPAEQQLPVETFIEALTRLAPQVPAIVAMFKARAVVQRQLPEYWLAVEASIATQLTMLLSGNTNPCALIIQGPIGGGKSTTARMSKYSRIAYSSDKFTPASFVSHATNVPFDQLEDVDLLPRIKHRCLITEELSTIFRKSEEELQTSMSTITRVLDGEGFISDSGSHGRRGYTGDYLFTWLGASTELPPRAWKVMAQLGSRMLFFNLAGGGRSKAQKVADLTSGTDFLQKRDVCATFVSNVIDAFFPDDTAIRSVTWPREDPEDLVALIVDLADLLAVCRRMRESGGDMNTPIVFTPQEDSNRALALLFNLACARAIAYGRRRIEREDLDMLFHIVLSSMPEGRGPIIRAVVEGNTTYNLIAVATKFSNPTVRTKCKQLFELNVLIELDATSTSKHPGRPAAEIGLNDEYLWLENF